MQAEQQNVNEIQIDEEWFSSANSLIVDPNLLMCQVCYGVPLQDYAQCDQCGRIFCEKDFKQVKFSFNSCPNCKNSPFSKKYKPHIIYTSLFQRILFQCRLCDKEQNKHQNLINEAEKRNFDQIFQSKAKKVFTKQQLSDHLLNHHNKKVMDFITLYDFQINFDKGNEKVVFDLYQNIQLNQKYQESNMVLKQKSDFPYQLDSGEFIIINFQKQTVTSPILMKAGKLIKKPSKELKKGVNYEIWQVQIDVGYKNYSQKHQQLLKKEYQEFVKDQKKNEVVLDIGQQRYRISFTKMVQINTFTGFERPIRKNTVKFI